MNPRLKRVTALTILGVVLVGTGGYVGFNFGRSRSRSASPQPQLEEIASGEAVVGRIR